MVHFPEKAMDRTIRLLFTRVRHHDQELVSTLTKCEVGAAEDRLSILAKSTRTLSPSRAPNWELMPLNPFNSIAMKVRLLPSRLERATSRGTSSFKARRFRSWVRGSTRERLSSRSFKTSSRIKARRVLFSVAFATTDKY